MSMQKVLQEGVSSGSVTTDPTASLATADIAVIQSVPEQNSGALALHSDLMHTFWSSHTYKTLSTYAKRMKGHAVCVLVCTLASILGASVVIVGILHLRTQHLKRVTIGGTFGTVQGYAVGTTGRSIYASLGIPFAKPPVAEYRFKKPIVLDAIPDGEDFTSEDCLHLNVWTPTVHCSEATTACGKRTVLFILHGDFFHSWLSWPDQGCYLASLQDLVVVIPKYRLGVPGFLNAGIEDAPGNVGLYDQLAALEWEKKHIFYFGGNASDMLMWHGSGFSAAGHLLLTGRLQCLKRAILINETPPLLGVARRLDD